MRNLLLAALAASTLVLGCGGDRAVEISIPAQTLHTNGVATLQVAILGDPKKVTLLRGDALLAQLEAPYQYAWDTRGEPEGSYEIKALVEWEGGGEDTSEARTIVVDRTRPRVVSRTPAGGLQTDGWGGDPITATFSEPLLPASVTDDAIGVVVGELIPVVTTATLSGDGLTVTAVPAPPPDTFGLMTARFSPILSDLAGNPVVDDGSAWTWRPAVWDQLPNTSANGGNGWNGGIDVALDAQGNPYVAFTEQPGFISGESELYVHRWNGAAWEPLGGGLGVYIGASTHSLYPSIALAPDGAPWVAWVETDLSGVQHVTAKRWNGSAWEAMGSPFSRLGGTTNTYYAQLEFDGTGQPVILYAERVASGNMALYTNQWNGTSWEALGGDVRGSIVHDADAPQLVKGHNGQLWAAWIGTYATAGYVVHTSRFSGTSWDFAGRVHGDPADGTSAWTVKLASSPQGDMFLAWIENSGGDYLYTAEYSFAMGWRQRGRIGSGGVESISLAVGTDRRATLAYMEAGDVRVRRFQTAYNGWSWPESNPLALDPESYPLGLAMGANGQFTALAVHDYREPIRSSVNLRRSTF